jgi:predicted O-methyltransferase YrrM
MRYKRHWTPLYAYNRIRLMQCERAHPDDPWLTPESVRLLTSMLRPSDRGVEFGSGRSTIWFAERVGHLTSVEHCEEWYTTVSNTLKRRELTNVDYILAPRDQPDELGGNSAYTRTARAFADESIDFALVDGLYREHVTKLVMPKVRTGGFIIVDNANWFLPSRTRSPSSRTFQLGPNGPVWADLAKDLAGWRSIWTSSGVTDTAIFLKP